MLLYLQYHCGLDLINFNVIKCISLYEAFRNIQVIFISDTYKC